MESDLERIAVASDLKVMCVVKRWEHHTPSGGYEKLADAVGAEVVYRTTNRTLSHRIANRLWREFSSPKPYLLDYRYEDSLAEQYVIKMSRARPLDVVHLLNGDEQLDLLLRKRERLLSSLVATFHLSPDRVRDRFENVQKHLLSGIDLAVVVAKSQLQDFAHWLGPDRVVFIPHGINTERFCPGEPGPQHEGLRLLSVGHHMRDWKAIDRIIAETRCRRLAVRFDIVAPQDERSGLAQRDNVHFHQGISEEQLIRLYRESDALLMPVIDATATNAALEALACGTPVISNLVGGMPDYIDGTCGWLFEKGEVNGIVQLINDISDRPEIASPLRRGARSKALGFSWNSIAEKMRMVYAAAARRRSPQPLAM